MGPAQNPTMFKTFTKKRYSSQLKILRTLPGVMGSWPPWCSCAHHYLQKEKEISYCIRQAGAYGHTEIYVIMQIMEETGCSPTSNDTFVFLFISTRKPPALPGPKIKKGNGRDRCLWASGSHTKSRLAGRVMGTNNTRTILQLRSNWGRKMNDELCGNFPSHLLYFRRLNGIRRL